MNYFFIVLLVALVVATSGYSQRGGHLRKGKLRKDTCCQDAFISPTGSIFSPEQTRRLYAAFTKSMRVI